MSRAAGRAGTAILLVAAAVVPILANPHSSRGFEEDRVIILRLLGSAGLITVLLCPAFLPRLGLPLLAACLYLLASISAALGSEIPATAMAGEYLRQAGLATDIGLMGVFLLAAGVATRSGLSRLFAEVLLLGGAAAALLGGAQSLGLEVPFASQAAATRAAAFTGGPTFLGSQLAVLLPLAVARAQGRMGGALAAVLAAGLLLTGSRVALLAALAGVALVALAAEPARRRVVLLAAGALVALLLAAACTPLRGLLPADSLPSRIASEFLGRELEVRGLIYRDAAAAVLAEPEHLLLGRGPDTVGPLFTQQISAELQRRLGGARRVDRLHSDPLDLLYTRGLLAPLALLLLALGALLAARRSLRAGLQGGEAQLAAGLAGGLVANYLDGLFSVPGSISRLLLFAAAGWLAGRAAAPREAEDSEPGPAARGILCGVALSAALFSLGSLAHLWVALPFLLLLPAAGRTRALGAAAAVFLPFLGLHLFLDPGGAATRAAFGAQVAAERARLETLLLLALVAAAVFLLARAGRADAARGAERIVPDRPRAGKIALAALAALAFCRLAYDDALRLLADVNARSAEVIRLARGSPAEEARLLAQATEWAPQVSEYRGRLAAALVREARRGGERAPAELVLELGRQLGLGLERHEEDAFFLAQGAKAILEFARLLPEQSTGLSARALDLAERAARRAPTASPVLEVLAEVDIHVGRPFQAIELLDAALAIDESRRRTLLLRGRAEVAARNVSGAAFYYGRARLAPAPADEAELGVNEALAGLALAAASQGVIEDAAALVLLLAERAPLSPYLEADVQGARPLLYFVPWHVFNELFQIARAQHQGEPLHLDRVEKALAY